MIENSRIDYSKKEVINDLFISLILPSYKTYKYTILSHLYLIHLEKKGKRSQKVRGKCQRGQ